MGDGYNEWLCISSAGYDKSLLSQELGVGAYNLPGRLGMGKASTGNTCI